MRLAILTNAYPPDARGGAGQIAWLQVEGLRARGHEVQVWHVPLAWSHQSIVRRLGHHLYDLIKPHECIGEILAWKPDRLLTHNLTGIGFSIPKQIQKEGIPWVHVLHDVQLFEPSGQISRWDAITAWQRMWSTLRASALGKPNAVISPTQNLLTAHKRRGFFLEVPTVVIPNPAPPLWRSKRARHQPLRALFVGRWSSEKGARLLEVLWSGATTSLIEWHLIGPGTNDLVPPLGVGYGSQDVSQILARMREVDVLCVPSQLMENQPTVLLEAMSQGLPVIASQQAGIEETLGAAGVLCNPVDVSSWERALDNLIREDDAAYQMRVTKMYDAWSRHEASKVLQRVEEVLVTLN